MMSIDILRRCRPHKDDEIVISGMSLPLLFIFCLVPSSASVDLAWRL